MPPVLTKIHALSDEQREIWRGRSEALSYFYLGFNILDEDAHGKAVARLRAIETELGHLWVARRRERTKYELQGGF